MIDANNPSIYVGNADYGATADELKINFNGCTPVKRVTILWQVLGSSQRLCLNWVHWSRLRVPLDCMRWCGGALKEFAKRTNMPGISARDRRGHRRDHTEGRGWSYCPPRYQNCSPSKLWFQFSRLQHQSPHPYYGGTLPSAAGDWVGVNLLNCRHSPA